MNVYDAMLIKVSAQPGKPASALTQHAADIRALRELVKIGNVVFKSGGWYLTDKGDLRLATAVLEEAQAQRREEARTAKTEPSAAVRQLRGIMDLLDEENDEQRRADYINEAIELADRYPDCKAEWEAYR